MSASLFPRLPQEVMLRNRTFATVQTVDGAAPFALLGRLGFNVHPGHLLGATLGGLGISERGYHSAWQRNGRWSEKGANHPLDIIGVVVRRDKQSVEVAPYAPAAGAEKGAA